MADMPPVRLPYLASYRPRGGRTFWYFRRAGKQVRLPDPADPAFAAAYDAALRGESFAKAPEIMQKVRTPPPGTFAALVALYKASPDFLSLSPASRCKYAAYLAPLVASHGHAAVRDVPRDWVQRRQAERIATPRAANYMLSVIRKLFNFGIDAGWLTVNPAARVKPYKGGRSHRVWTAAEIAAMTGPKAGDVALPCLLALHTAQRQGDVLRLAWSAYDGATIKLRQAKTGLALTVPVAPALAAALDAITPRTSVVICLTCTGRPWTSGHFVHRFAEMRASLDLPADLHFHGLRHTAATRLAESGASAHEIQAVTGHKTLANVTRYTQEAGQAVLARNAVARLPKTKA